MMKNYDESVEINCDPKWPYIPDHPYRIIVIVCSRLGKTNVLIKYQRPHIDRIYLYVKHSFQSKYQLVISGIEKVGIKQLKSPKAIIDYSQAIDVFKNLEGCNPTKKRKVLVVLDDMMADMEANKNQVL